MLREAGVKVPAGQQLRAVEPATLTGYVILPPSDAPDGPDAAARARLRTDPVAALGEAGIAVPADVSMIVLEEDDATGYMIVPPAPEEFDPSSSADDVVGYFTCAGPA